MSGFSPNTYHPTPITFRFWRRLQQVQYEIDIATGKWEKATEELEKVMGAAGGGDGE